MRQSSTSSPSEWRGRNYSASEAKMDAARDGYMLAIDICY